MKKVNMSKFFTVNVRDFLHGLIVTIGTAFGTGIVTILSNGSMPSETQVHQIGLAAGAAGGTYLIKKLLTNSDDKMLTPEVK